MDRGLHIRIRFLFLVIILAFFVAVGCSSSLQSVATPSGNPSNSNSGASGNGFIYVADANGPGGVVRGWNMHSDGALTAVDGSPFSVGGIALAGTSDGRLWSVGNVDASLAD